MKSNINESSDVAIFGSGAIASSCVEFLRKSIYGHIFVFEKKEHNISILQKRISDLPNIEYSVVDDHIEDIILKIKPKIIFSIGNTFIFRKPILELCPIINYHNALLPKHPGRNAEAWAIFSQDKETGVTWHLVDGTVDTGDIIMQRTIPLATDITSIELLSLQAEVALNMFQEIAANILAGREIPLFRQECRENINYHYSWESPNDGVLETDWDFAAISAFLRAMDYGRLSLLGKPSFVIDDTKYIWKKYLIKPHRSKVEEFIDLSEDVCTIVKKDGIIELQGLERV